MAKKSITWDESSSAAENARAKLPKLLEAYFGQGRKLMDPSSSPAVMHRFRLETKALRYALELFRACYGPGLGRYLAALARIQDFLGAINDCETTRDLIASKLPASSSDRIKMERILRASMQRKWSEFRRYWRQTFARPGEERRWLNYLSRRTGVSTED
jgi:CHAD domain-containing protein